MDNAEKAPARTGRGCWWYFAVGAASLLGMVVLAVVAVVVAVVHSSNEISQSSVLVSRQEDTYLEAVTVEHGFMDPTYALAIYYTRAGTWFRARRRVLVHCDAGNRAGGIGFRRRLDAQGQLQIAVKRAAYMQADSAVMFVYTPPTPFEQAAAASAEQPGNYECQEE